MSRKEEYFSDFEGENSVDFKDEDSFRASGNNTGEAGSYEQSKPSLEGGNEFHSRQEKVPVNSSTIAYEFKKLNSKIDSVVAWIQQFYEQVNQNFESLNEAREQAVSAENLSPKFEKMEKEIASIKERLQMFISTEELLKLNEQSKKNLQEARELAAKGNKQSVQKSDSLEKVESELRMLSRDLFGIKNELSEFKRRPPQSDSGRESKELLEKTAMLAKHTKEAIGNFTFEEYHEKTDNLLRLIEGMAEEIRKLNEKMDVNLQEQETRKRSLFGGKDDFLEDIGEVPDLPELPLDEKNKKAKRVRRKGKR